MNTKRVTPILNVSNIVESFAWFGKLGWQKGWDWGDPPTFGGVCSGDVEIFLCQNNQGGRGENGVWLSIWIDDVDAIHRQCLANGIEVTMPPTDEPWNVREMHVRHPDGHIFRITQSLEEDE
jgi:uncharacterized glyoxalase superfamily protein PhnB